MIGVCAVQYELTAHLAARVYHMIYSYVMVRATYHTRIIYEARFSAQDNHTEQYRHSSMVSAGGGTAAAAAAAAATLQQYILLL